MEAIYLGENRKTRLPHLDALRGIAALLVIIGHCLLASKKPLFHLGNDEIFSSIPVTLFFLLSGYVLSRSIILMGGISIITICSYYVKRLFRLYPPAIASLILGIILARYYQIPEGVETTTWVKKVIIKAHFSGFDTTNLIRYMLLMNIKPNPVLWTIQVEIVCSMILPLLLAIKFSKSKPVILLLLLCIVGLKIAILSSLSCFYLGYLCSDQEHLIKKIPKSYRNSLAFLLLLLVAGSSSIKGYTILSIIIITIIFATLATNCDGWIFKLLMSKPTRYLGKISYASYLVHLPVILTLFVILHLRYGISDSFLCLLLLILSIFMTVILGSLFEFLIERPSNNIGHRMSKKISNRFICRKNLI